jgi:hypothetical protein
MSAMINLRHADKFKLRSSKTRFLQGNLLKLGLNFGLLLDISGMANGPRPGMIAAQRESSGLHSGQEPLTRSDGSDGRISNDICSPLIDYAGCQ